MTKNQKDFNYLIRKLMSKDMNDLDRTLQRADVVKLLNKVPTRHQREFVIQARRLMSDYDNVGERLYIIRTLVKVAARNRRNFVTQTCRFMSVSLGRLDRVSVSEAFFEVLKNKRWSCTCKST